MDKGRDNYLRDVGYWDRIPIDIHQQRFQLRTGIFFRCSPPGHADPLNKASFQQAFIKFCDDYLGDSRRITALFQENGFPDFSLQKSPGIADIFVYYFCADKATFTSGYQICAATPKCLLRAPNDDCPLFDTCLFQMLR